MSCSSPPSSSLTTPPPAYQLSVVFSSPQLTLPPSSLFCTWEYFIVEIPLRKNKHQWLNKLPYYFDVLLKRFVKGNSNLLMESRKLIECISRLFYCKTFFVIMKLSILIFCEKTLLTRNCCAEIITFCDFNLLLNWTAKICWLCFWLF